MAKNSTKGADKKTAPDKGESLTLNVNDSMLNLQDIIAEDETVSEEVKEAVGQLAEAIKAQPKRPMFSPMKEPAPPQEKTVEVEFLNDLAGIKKGHTKKLALSLAQRMEAKGKVKIL